MEKSAEEQSVNSVSEGSVDPKNEQSKIEPPKTGQPGVVQPKTPGRKLPKFLLPAFAFILTLLLIWKGIQIYEDVLKPGDTTVKFSPKKAVAQVGKETLYGQDLNYELKVYFPDVSKSKEVVSEEIKEKALNQIIRKSLLLQAAADEGLITLNEKVFNSLDKVYRERNILLNSIEEKVNTKYVNWVKGEMISIWFHNIYEPKMGLETARQVTRSKIEAIYNDLKSGKYANLEEAAEAIKNDPALALIDPSYKGNAYIPFEVKQGEEFFIDPKVQEQVFQLPLNQLSPILVGQDQSPGGEFYDCNFIVMKVLERKMRGYESFEDWFSQKKGNYEVEIKI